MCRSMVDIQSPTAEISLGEEKKEDRRKKKEERNYRMKILWSALLHRATINSRRKTVCPMLSDRSPVCLVLSVLSVCAGVLWPSGWMDRDETWHGVKPRPRPHCVRWGPSFPHPPKKEAQTPNFRRCLLWTNGWMDQDATY